ncbi:hypothetical protein [Mycoplasmopsis cynos]|uniref:Uncharacterized protein n=1 Tax=Mycoplasmopsis cynos TaxID=171284 RepID=A0A449AH99_9BACT|nr:hypothetical protein [Mycoplasmopsis cynos]VEU64327.1 Uncharacterised protein [Mycoplasmopsis cynos]
MDALTISDNITTLYVYKIKNFIEKQKLETNSKILSDLNLLVNLMQQLQQEQNKQI